MYGSSGSSSIGMPPPPSSDDAPPMAVANPRYVYLLSRLRTRQITMEEATELFALQQQLITAASATRSAPAPAPGAPAPPAAAGAVASGGFNDDGLALSLLAIGAGAGILAAVMKRAQEGPRKPSG